MIFKKPKNKLEGHSRLTSTISNDTDTLLALCPKCKKNLVANELFGHLNVCYYCDYHFRLNARQRVNIICDAGSFLEEDKDLISKNVIDFPEYGKKLEHAKLESAESDAVVCGVCTILGVRTAIFAMDPYFMMGSMGTVVGEKLTRLFEMALKNMLPVVGFTVSGGARIQEGIFSLMQMAKVSGAVKLHSDAGNLFVCVLTNPTMGGVTASFAMEADIIVAEPFAHIGFAGGRVIEQTIRKKLPTGFQEAEFLLEKGFLDDIVERKKQKKYIGQLLRIHSNKDDGR